MKRYLIVLAALLLISGCSKKFRIQNEDLHLNNDWPYYRGNLAGEGAITDGRYSGKLDIIWEYKSNDKPAGPLTIYGNRLVYPGTRNKIKFIDKLTGHYDGRIKPRGTPQSGLVAYDSLAYFAVGPKKSKLKCVNLLNGKTVWKKRVKDAVCGSIIVLDKLIIGSAEGQLYAFDLKSGEIIWSFQADGRFNVPPVYNNRVLFQPTDDGQIIALNIENGSRLFTIQLDRPLVSPVTINSYHLYAADIDGNIYKIDTENGKIVWTKDFHLTTYSSPTVSNDRLFFGSSNGIITALNIAGGDIIWQYDVVDVIRSSVLVAGDFLLFGTMTGDFYSLNTADGSVVAQRKLKGAIAVSPVSDGERIYVATEKGIVTCFGEYHESTKAAN